MLVTPSHFSAKSSGGPFAFSLGVFVRSGPSVPTQQISDIRRHRKFRGVAEAAVLGIERSPKILLRRRERLGLGPPARGIGRSRVLRHGARQARRVVDHVLAAVLPESRQVLKQRRPARAMVLRPLRMSSRLGAYQQSRVANVTWQPGIRRSLPVGHSRQHCPAMQPATSAAMRSPWFRRRHQALPPRICSGSRGWISRRPAPFQTGQVAQSS